MNFPASLNKQPKINLVVYLSAILFSLFTFKIKVRLFWEKFILFFFACLSRNQSIKVIRFITLIDKSH